MSKDTVELIKKKSINLCCLPIFSYISSLIIVPNAPFSQSLSHMCVCRGPKSVGGITWAKHAHAQSQYWAVKSDQCHPYYSFRLR